MQFLMREMLCVCVVGGGGGGDFETFSALFDSESER